MDIKTKTDVMTRRFFILLHCLVVMITASTQDAMVTKFANIPCDSDELLLKTIPYFNITAEGEKNTWDLSNLSFVGTKKIRHTSICKGSIISITNHDITYYWLNNDVLFVTGKESPLCKVEYSVPLLKMRYPLAYGDSVSMPFKGNGIYCGDHYFREQGFATVIADAMGKILLDDDTLYNTIRISTLKSYSICMNMDSLSLDTASTKQVIELRYDWYARGYRYPIITTISKTSYSGMQSVGTKQEAFCLFPRTQRSAKDTINAEIRSNDSILLSNNATENKDIIHFSLSQSDNNIAVNYSLDESANIIAILSDVMGIVYRHNRQYHDKGDGYVLNIDTGGIRNGEYILYLNVNGKIYNNKIKL